MRRDKQPTKRNAKGNHDNGEASASHGAAAGFLGCPRSKIGVHKMVILGFLFVQKCTIFAHSQTLKFEIRPIPPWQIIRLRQKSL